MKVKNFFFISFLFSILILISLQFFLKDNQYGKIDFVQYYSASYLFLNNKNPYNKNNFNNYQLNLKENINKDFIYMYNPPIVLPFISILSLFEYEVASIIWRFLTILLISVSIFTLFTIFTFKNKYILYSAIISCFCFAPIFSILFYGQISFILFFFYICHLQFLFSYIKNKNIKQLVISGLFLSALCIKPHVLILLIPLILIVISFKEFYKLLSGFILGSLTLGLFPLIFDATIYSKYFEYISNPPIFWETPTLGSWLQYFTGVHTTLIRFIPTILVFVLMLIFISYKRYKNIEINRDLFFQLLPLCLISCPYFWIFDYILLMPAIFYYLFIIDKTKDFKVFFICLFFLLIFSTFMLDRSMGQQYFVYFPIVLNFLILLQLIVNKTKRIHYLNFYS